jgi:hypothetical protein
VEREKLGCGSMLRLGARSLTLTPALSPGERETRWPILDLRVVSVGYRCLPLLSDGYRCRPYRMGMRGKFHDGESDLVGYGRNRRPNATVPDRRRPGASGRTVGGAAMRAAV